MNRVLVKRFSRDRNGLSVFFRSLDSESGKLNFGSFIQKVNSRFTKLKRTSLVKISVVPESAQVTKNLPTYIPTPTLRSVVQKGSQLLPEL